MHLLEFGDPSAQAVLIQPVDEHDLEVIENEARLISENCDAPFRLVAVKVHDWNADLSPWSAPAVFGNNAFSGKARDTLDSLLALCPDNSKDYFIGGYSLAGLFSLWAAYQTDVFKGLAAVSPSVWFDGWTDYAENHTFLANKAYLSLGDREAKTRNQTMATVADNIIRQEQLLKNSNIPCVLEWNEGNHFRDSDLRTAKGFCWLLKR